VLLFPPLSNQAEWQPGHCVGCQWLSWYQQGQFLPQPSSSVADDIASSVSSFAVGFWSNRAFAPVRPSWQAFLGSWHWTLIEFADRQHPQMIQRSETCDLRVRKVSQRQIAKDSRMAVRVLYCWLTTFRSWFYVRYHWMAVTAHPTALLGPIASESSLSGTCAQRFHCFPNQGLAKPNWLSSVSDLHFV
jgi:hypothetical protein